ncbi:MAG TPA: hypothetical protein VJ201_05000 [Candidatus Babeliales bacterium]|nr:hypothetical protein [Candidatus Babeliales bacterium]
MSKFINRFFLGCLLIFQQNYSGRAFIKEITNNSVFPLSLCSEEQKKCTQTIQPKQTMHWDEPISWCEHGQMYVSIEDKPVYWFCQGVGPKQIAGPHPWLLPTGAFKKCGPHVINPLSALPKISKKELSKIVHVDRLSNIECKEGGKYKKANKKDLIFSKTVHTMPVERLKLDVNPAFAETKSDKWWTAEGWQQMTKDEFYKQNYDQFFGNQPFVVPIEDTGGYVRGNCDQPAQLVISGKDKNDLNVVVKLAGWYWNNPFFKCV